MRKYVVTIWGMIALSVILFCACSKVNPTEDHVNPKIDIEDIVLIDDPPPIVPLRSSVKDSIKGTQIMSLIDDSGNKKIAVHYPLCENKDINSDVEARLDSLVDAFRNSVDDALYIDFETYRCTESIVSYVFSIQEFHEFDAKNSLMTMTFDMNTGEELAIKSLFVSNINCYDLLSATALQELEASAQLGKKLDINRAMTGLKPIAENFKNFSLDYNQMVLYFDAGAIAPQSSGPQKISIDFADFGNFLNEKILLPDDFAFGENPKNGVPIEVLEDDSVDNKDVANDSVTRENPTELEEMIPDESSLPSVTTSETSALKATSGGAPVFNEKMIAIGIEDGPNYKYTEQLLKLLSQKKATVSFFIMGNHVKYNSEIIAKMIAGGHEIANHSFDHKDMLHLNKEQIQEEIQKTNDAILASTGKFPTLFYAPFNAYDTRLDEICSGIDMRLVKDPITYPQNSDSVDAKTVIDQLLEKAQGGTVYMLRDDSEQDYNIAVGVISGLIGKGYEIVGVSNVPIKQ